MAGFLLGEKQALRFVTPQTVDLFAGAPCAQDDKLVSRAGWLGVSLVVAGDLDFAGEAELGEHPDEVEVGINLVPCQAVLGRNGMGVVVVVPAFAAGENGDPEAVAGIIAGFKTAAAPKVGGRVDQPGGMQAEGNAKEDAPKDHLDAAHDAVVDPGAEAHEDDSTGDEGKPVVLAHPDMEAVAGEIGNVAGQSRCLGVHGLAEDHPANVSPPGAFFRSVRVAGMVAVLVMDAVYGNPEDRSALKRERGADGEQVLDPLGSLEAAMREQAMVAD